MCSRIFDAIQVRDIRHKHVPISAFSETPFYFSENLPWNEPKSRVMNQPEFPESFYRRVNDLGKHGKSPLLLKYMMKYVNVML